ncbi:MAG TPA: rod shape-determining protein MreD [Streptosporangiaceae bacterium]|nr:rod shape-determining protein MreD [Streptosporangiaceae bacterium]
MRRAALSAILVALAVVLQLTVINRLPLPGGGSPDLVLLVVIALAMCGGPVPGAITGFCAGLCLDLAPPGSQLIGEYALVFCVVGYACGKLRGTLGRPARLSLPALICAAAAAAAGEVLSAGLSVALDPSGVSLASVRQVLPSSVLYDVLISSFVLAAIVAVSRWAVGRQAQGTRDSARPGGSPRSQAAPGGAAAGGGTVGLSSGAGLLGGVGWLAGPVSARAARKSAKRGLRLGEKSVRPGDGWIGRRPPSWHGPATGYRAAVPLHLSPGSGVAGTAARRSHGSRRLARPVNLRLAAKRGTGRPVAGRGRQTRPGLPHIAFSAGSARPGAGSWSSGQRRPGTQPGAASRSARGPSFRHGPSLGYSPGVRRGPSSGHRFGSGRGPSFRSGPSLRPAAFRPGPSFRSGPSAFRPGPSFRSGASSLRPSAFRSGSGSAGRLAAGGRGRPARGTLTGRPVSLRLRAGRRRDGAVGGRAPGGVLPRGRRVFTTSRPAAPRFRARQRGSAATTGGPGFRPGAGGSRRGKMARLQSGRRSVLSLWTRRRRGGRSAVWRIGSSRTGGFR